VLFEIKPLDLATFALVPLVLIGFALVACLAPALRAAMLDPVAALRQE
jgi:ABC-type lipoprotein release transport system permease subunit